MPDDDAQAEPCGVPAHQRLLDRRVLDDQLEPTFAPDGLYLTAVEYDTTFDLPPTARPVTGA